MEHKVSTAISDIIISILPENDGRDSYQNIVLHIKLRPRFKPQIHWESLHSPMFEYISQ